MTTESLALSASAALGLTAIAVFWVILLVRLGGLRSLSKMTGFDFITTIAVGSLIATAGTANSAIEFVRSMTAIAAVFGLQWLLAKWRVGSRSAQKLLGNDPVLLMEHGTFLDDAMARARITRADIYAKMREAGVTKASGIRAVVLERTGDVSIIEEGPLDGEIMEGVAGYEHSDAA